MYIIILYDICFEYTRVNRYERWYSQNRHVTCITHTHTDTTILEGIILWNRLTSIGGGSIGVQVALMSSKIPITKFYNIIEICLPATPTKGSTP